MKILTKISAAIMLSLSMCAHAGMIIDWEGTGVDFYSSWMGDTLRIEIDAADPGAGWANAKYIDALAINGPEAWTWVNPGDISLTLTHPDPFSGFSGPIDAIGLNAGGCHKSLVPNNLGGNHQCWRGVAGLTDNMYFDFKFGGDSVVLSETDNPHLKVRFVDQYGDKVGSLLSADLHSVPEPSVLLLMGAGLAGLGFACRGRTKKA